MDYKKEGISVVEVLIMNIPAMLFLLLGIISFENYTYIIIERLCAVKHICWNEEENIIRYEKIAKII